MKYAILALVVGLLAAEAAIAQPLPQCTICDGGQCYSYRTIKKRAQPLPQCTLTFQCVGCPNGQCATGNCANCPSCSPTASQQPTVTTHSGGGSCANGQCGTAAGYGVSYGYRPYRPLRAFLFGY